ncbi:MAG: hypothetical protein HYS78_01845 [Parcubacteria group bacterium]|nr:hypothetical protein [Parcubacteria group bacterium]
MFDSIFAKTILLLASLLTVLTGTDYIKISSDSLTYDFKTNDRTPIYYFLNTENAGIKKVRFDVTSLSNWVSVYKEGDQASAKTSLELAQYSPLNFVLEIHPERLPDGVNKAKVTVEAVDLQDYSVLELKEVNIAVNKNFPPAADQPSAGKVSPSSEPTPEAGSLITVSPWPAASLSPALTPILTPLKAVSFSPKPVLTSSPSLIPLPDSSSVPQSFLKQVQSVIDSIKLFLKRFF